MATQKKAMEALKPSLTAAIERWISANCDGSPWLGLDTYVGDNLASYMSDAAMAVLGGLVDLSNYHRDNDDFK